MSSNCRRRSASSGRQTSRGVNPPDGQATNDIMGKEERVRTKDILQQNKVNTDLSSFACGRESFQGRRPAAWHVPSKLSLREAHLFRAGLWQRFVSNRIQRQSVVVCIPKRLEGRDLTMIASHSVEVVFTTSDRESSRREESSVRRTCAQVIQQALDDAFQHAFRLFVGHGVPGVIFLASTNRTAPTGPLPLPFLSGRVERI